MSDVTPKRDSLIRAVCNDVELRSEGDSGMPQMVGNFAVLNQWTEIRSSWEGNFMERFAPGSLRKTLRDSRDKMQVLFQHGADPQIGDKPLGSITELRETDEGAYYEVDLLDTQYVREVLPGLQAGLYGASFRFSVVREPINENPERSEHNPNGLPERTVKEAKVMEFGPVTFPAYAGATAGVRSMTDDFLAECFRSDPERLERMFEQARAETGVEPLERAEIFSEEQQDAPAEDDAEPIAESDPVHLTDARRETITPAVGRQPIYGACRKEQPSWLL